MATLLVKEEEDVEEEQGGSRYPPTSFEKVIYCRPNCSWLCFCMHLIFTLFHFLPTAALESLSLLVKVLVFVRALPALDSGMVIRREEGSSVM